MQNNQRRAMSWWRIFVVILIGVASASISKAQKADLDSMLRQADIAYPLEYEGVLKTNPLSVLWGSIPLTSEYMVVYEFITAPQQSSQIGLSYISKSPVLKAFEDTIPDLKLLTANGVRMQLSHRFYLLKGYDFAPQGMYIAPQVSYATVKVSTKHYSSRDVYVRITHFNVNLLSGWQWVYSSNYTLDLFTGLGYKDNIWEEHDSQTTISLDNDDVGGWYSGNVKFTIGFHLGIAF